MKPRNLFDIAVGTDNLFHAEHRKTALRLTVTNLTNKVALYNFLSTFSGTHFVAPRTYLASVHLPVLERAVTYLRCTSLTDI